MKKIGIIGGLGPMATVYYLELLTRMVDTMVDQGHPRILLQSISDSPDRTAYITGKSTQSPLPLLVETARSLQNAWSRFFDDSLCDGTLFLRTVDTGSRHSHCQSRGGDGGAARSSWCTQGRDLSNDRSSSERSFGTGRSVIGESRSYCRIQTAESD